MPSYSATAPGKVILFGEHAVVYNRPALAVPVNQVKAKAIVTPNIQGERGSVVIDAPDIGLRGDLRELPVNQPIAAAIKGVFAALNVTLPPALSIKISSSIPVASGLGSGAAVSVAVVRALSGFLGNLLPDEQISAIAYEVEKLHHGTPSGVDNTVVTFAQPVFFVRGEPIRTLQVKKPFTIVIGDTGIQSPTAIAVGDVRRAWEQDRLAYEAIFDVIARIAYQARNIVEGGDPKDLGSLMDENHGLLQQLGVSSPELDRLVAAAREAGALGAKLSGGGRGGNMIALVRPENGEEVAGALRAAGAVRVITTDVKPRD